MRPCTACASWSLHTLSACVVQLTLGRSGTLARQCGLPCAHPGHALAFRQVTGWHDAERHAVCAVSKAGAPRKLCQGKRARALALTQSACACLARLHSSAAL